MLKGTKTEHEIRKQLINSRLIRSNENESKLYQALKSVGVFNFAHILHWTPEQGEDIYLVLINDNFIVKIEIDKIGETEPIIDFISLSRYRKGLKKQGQIQLEIAIELSRTITK